MKFILETPAEEKRPTFEDVEINQFFVSACGELCQKVSDMTYNVIAFEDGGLYAKYRTKLCRDFAIKRTLPKVAKIEF